MSRTNIDIDEEACRRVMDRYHPRSKRDAVNLALRIVAAEVLDVERARRRGARGGPATSKVCERVEPGDLHRPLGAGGAPPPHSTAR